MASTLPKPGDLIEIFRGPYEHWAVYIGDDFVIHLTSVSDFAAANARSGKSGLPRAIVKKEKLLDVVGKDEWKVNNIGDNNFTPRSPEDIVQEAERRVGEEVNYHLGKFNCEHFANELRYGKKRSWQGVLVGAASVAAVWAGATVATQAVAGAVVLAPLAPVAAVGAAAAVYVYGRRFLQELKKDGKKK